MVFLKASIALIIGLVYCATALEHGQRFSGMGSTGPNGRETMLQGHQGQGRGFGSSNGGIRAFDQGKAGKYRSKLYSDDDVYGYEANYPGGEALYINYRSNDARARRGPEFSRSAGRRGSFGSEAQDGMNHGNYGYGNHY